MPRCCFDGALSLSSDKVRRLSARTQGSDKNGALTGVLMRGALMAAFLAICERTAVRALLATLVTAVCWSGPARPTDTYPAQDGRSVQTAGPAKPDDSAACIAYGGGPGSGWTWGWQDEQTGCGDPALHLAGFVCFVPYPLENGWCHKLLELVSSQNQMCLHLLLLAITSLRLTKKAGSHTNLQPQDENSRGLCLSVSLACRLRIAPGCLG